MHSTLPLAFLCLQFFVPFESFPLTWRRHYCPWRAANVLSMLGTYGYRAVPQLLGHGESVYNGHFRGPVTLTPIAERLAVELSLPVLMTWVWRGFDSNTQPSARGDNALIQCALATVCVLQTQFLCKYLNFVESKERKVIIVVETSKYFTG